MNIFAAAVVRKSGEPLQVEEIQVDPPKAGEARIKMLCASMCHTDILCCNGLPVVRIQTNFLSYVYISYVMFPTATFSTHFVVFSASLPPDSGTRRSRVNVFSSPWIYSTLYI